MYANAITTVSPTYASEAVDGGAAGWLKSTFARPDIRAKFKVTLCCKTPSYSFALLHGSSNHGAPASKAWFCGIQAKKVAKVRVCTL